MKVDIYQLTIVKNYSKKSEFKFDSLSLLNQFIYYLISYLLTKN
jgi:hypothetical protein